MVTKKQIPKHLPRLPLHRRQGKRRKPWTSNCKAEPGPQKLSCRSSEVRELLLSQEQELARCYRRADTNWAISLKDFWWWCWYHVMLPQFPPVSHFTLIHKKVVVFQCRWSWVHFPLSNHDCYFDPGAGGDWKSTGVRKIYDSLISQKIYDM